MNKAELDEALKTVLSNPYDPYDSTVLQAARKYAELLSHLEALKGKEGELLSCPFCDGEVELSTTFICADTYFGDCYNDDCPSFVAGTKEEAIKAWNTRPTLSAILKILEG